MSGKPLVSIVLPVYNGARFLRQSIESCLQQTYRDIELIVVDDGSTDTSVDIVKSYDDDRIKLVCHQMNRKLPAALNTGFAHSSGAYLTWTSHDNYYVPTAIADMVNFLEENPHIDFVFTDEYKIDEAGQFLWITKNGPVERLPEDCCVGACFLYTRRVYEKLGPYDERAFLAEDYDYFLRALAHFTFGHLQIPLYYYRWHSNSLTGWFGDRECPEAALAVRRRTLGQNLWRNRMVLHRTHLSAAFGFYEGNRRSAAARAALWAIAFNPKCLAEYRVLVLLAWICFGQSGFRLLQRAKHAIRAAASDQP
jgi:glycosyltransferase involved in cell wall biosynthesis